MSCVQLYLEIIHQEEALTERERVFELELERLHDDVRKLQLTTYQMTQQCNDKASGSSSFVEICPVDGFLVF